MLKEPVFHKIFPKIFHKIEIFHDYDNFFIQYLNAEESANPRGQHTTQGKRLVDSQKKVE